MLVLHLADNATKDPLSPRRACHGDAVNQTHQEIPPFDLWHQDVTTPRLADRQECHCCMADHMGDGPGARYAKMPQSCGVTGNDFKRGLPWKVKDKDYKTAATTFETLAERTDMPSVCLLVLLGVITVMSSNHRSRRVSSGWTLHVFFWLLASSSVVLCGATDVPGGFATFVRSNITSYPSSFLLHSHFNKASSKARSAGYSVMYRPPKKPSLEATKYI